MQEKSLRFIWVAGPALAVLAIAAALLATAHAGRPTWVPTGAPAQPTPVVAQRLPKTTDGLIVLYQRAVRSAPGDAESLASLGAAYYQKARETADPSYYVKAEAVLAVALKHDPLNTDALVVEGTLENARHHFANALALGERAKAANNSVPRIYGVIADAQTELGRYDDAAATLQTMVDLRPDLGSYSRISYARELHGDIPGAIESMQDAVLAGGPSPENNAWSRMQLAHLYFASGDLRAAEQQYLATLAAVSDYPYASAGLAHVRAAQGRYSEAADLYRQAITRLPMPEFVIALGELEQARGDSAAASRQYALVQAMQQLNIDDGVDVDMELALFDADHGGDPVANLARARAAYGRRPSVYAADALSWALYRAGDFVEARRYSRRALRLGSHDAVMHFHAGMIAAALGNRGDARRKLRRALSINPYFSVLQAPEARMVLVRL